MTTRLKTTFTGVTGAQLDAQLELPVGSPRAFAVFAHCFTCGKDVVAASRISRALVDCGFGVLRFDFTGLGSSEGDFANTNFSSNVGDLVAAADMLRREHMAPSLLVGHSLGGAAVIAAASSIDEITAVATIGAPFEPGHVRELFDPADIEAIDADGEATVTLAGRDFRVRRQFLDDVSAASLAPALGSLRRALLVMHSPIDELVGIDNARQIFEAARHPKSFVSLDGANHLLTDRTDATYVASVLSAWASRYLPADESAPVDQAPADGLVVVAETGTGDFTQTIRAGRHVWTADEPIGVGDDTGPNPYELLMAGLGACTSMTIRMYANRKGFPLDHVSVELRHERGHADDCVGVEGPCRIERIERRIELRGELDDDQRAKLMAIADKCPVHRTLTGDLRIFTEMV